MNDFTKEELQIILLELDIRLNKPSPLRIAESFSNLRYKVASMIDKYAEMTNFCCKKCNEEWEKCECKD